MFDVVSKNTITVWVEKPTKGVFTIPSGDARLASKRLWEILSWINDEFLTDAAEESAKGEQFFDDDFTTRNMSRMISYIIHACLLEGILEKMYANMFVTLSNYGIKDLVADSVGLANRASEMKEVQEFRNTVAAHTAYSDPHPKKDDFLSEINSLHAFLSAGITGSDYGSFMMNVVTVGGDGVASKRPIPKLGLRRVHDEMQKHFEQWEKMFVATLEAVNLMLPISTPEYRVEKQS